MFKVTLPTLAHFNGIFDEMLLNYQILLELLKLRNPPISVNWYIKLN